MLNPRRLAAGENGPYDLRKIRDEQIPDRNGNPIPRSIEGGQFRWFIHGPGSGRLIGRAEMLSVSQGVSSSYSCPEAGECPTQFSYAFLSPSNVYLAPGDYAVVHAEEVDCDDYFNCTPSFTPYVRSECPTQFSYAFLSPSNVYLAPGDYAVVHAEEVDCDDYFNCTPSFTPYV